MRKKSIELKTRIVDYINDAFRCNNKIPTIREIASELSISKSCVSNYIQEMTREGMLEKSEGWYGVRTKEMQMPKNFTMLPVVGIASCGQMKFTEQNIERQIAVPSDWLGSGKYFVVVTEGNSMINAGITDGSSVIIRMQNTAEEGQIVIARTEDETTLKRYYIDRQKKKIRLHPENDSLQDMYFDNIEIQGIAVKVFKDLL